MDRIGRYKTKNPRKSMTYVDFWMPLDGVGQCNGGGGGNRTRVQKHSTDSSTYLVLPIGFNPADAGARASSRRVTYF
jgi:hypothetical protein